MSPIFARKTTPADSEEIPEEPDRIFGRFSAVADAREVREVWGAEEVSPGVFESVRVWRVPEPPPGVTPDLEQFEVSGGDVEASWINTTSEYSIVVEWEINSISWGTDTRPPGSTTSILAEAELSNFDQVRARMRYFEGSVQGDWSDWSDTLNYQA